MLRDKQKARAGTQAAERETEHKRSPQEGEKQGFREHAENFPSCSNRRASLSSLSLSQGPVTVCGCRGPMWASPGSLYPASCAYQHTCICWLWAAQGSLSVRVLRLSLIVLHGLQVVKGKQERWAPRAQVVAPVPATGGVWHLSGYAVSVRKAKAVLPKYHHTAKPAALDPLLSVKIWWWTSIILFLLIICMPYHSCHLLLVRSVHCCRSRMEHRVGGKPWVVLTWLVARVVHWDTAMAWG